jgi:hypothetical protein
VQIQLGLGARVGTSYFLALLQLLTVLIMPTVAITFSPPSASDDLESPMSGQLHRRDYLMDALPR